VKTLVEAAWDQDLYAADREDRRAVLRAVSPLAEGADRLFADEALNLGYTLCCIMPFRQAQFEEDFVAPTATKPDALDEFRAFLVRGEQNGELVKYELDGLRTDPPAAYDTAGKVVLNQSDLLIVIWDGTFQGQRGGTEKTFADALARGVPCIWIDAHNPDAWQLVDSGHPLPVAAGDGRMVPVSTADPEAMARQIAKLIERLLSVPVAEPTTSAAEQPRMGWRRLFGLPFIKQVASFLKAVVRGVWRRFLDLPPAGEEPRAHLKAFLAERRPRFSLAVSWDIFQSLVTRFRWPRVRFRIPDHEEAMEKEWPRDQSSPAARVTDRLRPFYAWPDKLAVLYADRYRSAFLLTFLLAAFAVGMALVPVWARLASLPWVAVVCHGLELVAILSIIALILWGWRSRWHERWLEYRMIAEWVRHLRFVAPLGGTHPLPPIPAHWTSYGKPSASWMAWYVRALERDLGLPTAVVDMSHLQTCLDQLIAVLKGQVQFHRAGAERSGRLEDRLHGVGLALLLATLLACAIHFRASLRDRTELFGTLTFCCGFFPALGAALAGIANQGEFRRIRKRSEAMRQQLEVSLKGIEDVAAKLRAEPDSPVAPSRQYSPEVSASASDAAQLMVNEVLDWRVVFLDRPLTPPA